MKRRTFLKKSFYTASAVALPVGIYTWQIEPFWLEFVKRKMPVQHLPDALVGKTLMQISDIHVGNRFDYQFIIDSFQKAQLLEPDIVVYTGDYVSYENEEQYGQLELVMRHTVKGKLATVGILGNHDYGKNWSEQKVADRISDILRDNGMTLLKNASNTVRGLNIIGFDDFWGLDFDPKKALSNYNEQEANILLCHNPDACDEDIWENYQGWILAGHTHGGQCKPPFLPPPVLPVRNKRYSAGEIDLTDGRKLYINRALGHLWQVRFNVRPEITIFELAQA